MRRRLASAASLRWPSVISIAAMLGFFGVPATAVASSGAPSLEVGFGNTAFPGKAVILSVPAHVSVPAGSVHLTENGRPVQGAAVTPLSSASPRDFGVVLAIDTSASMRGRSIQQAIAAARAIAAQRAGQQQLGVIVFSRKPRVLLPLTSDAAAIQNALSAIPPLQGGTAIYNALALAVQQLQQAKIVAGSVILISDGADNASAVSESAVAATARAARVTLDTIGIRSSTFNPRSLSAVARDGGGRFQTADATQLTGIVTSILTRLTQRYVVHYLSPATSRGRVVVTVRIDGIGSAQLEYSAPGPAPGFVVIHPNGKSFWASTRGLVAMSALAGLLITLAFFALLAPGRRRAGLRQRVGEFTLQTPEVLATETYEIGAPRPRFRALERLLERTRWWLRFKQNVEIAGFDRSAVELVVIDLIATLSGAVLIELGFRLVPLALLVLPAGAYAMRSIVKKRLTRQRALFAEQLAPHLEELSSTMRAGHGLLSGLTAMAKSAAEPSQREWSRVLADEQLGMPLDIAMQSLAERMACDDIEQVALVASLHSRTGGNMAEVLDRVADGVRERAELRRELHAMTSQARLSRWVVVMIPPVLVGLIMLIDPVYMRPLFTTTLGLVLLTVAIGLVIAGSLVMKALTESEV